MRGVIMLSAVRSPRRMHAMHHVAFVGVDHALLVAFAHQHADLLFGDASTGRRWPSPSSRSTRRVQHDSASTTGLARLGEEIHRDRRRRWRSASGRSVPMRLGTSSPIRPNRNSISRKPVGEARARSRIGRQPRDVAQRHGDLGAHRLAAEVADHQAQQADPQLHRRQEAFRVLGQVQRLARAAAGFRHVLEAALARGQHRHLRHREEAVAQDQHEDDQQFQHARGSMRRQAGGQARQCRATPVGGACRASGAGGCASIGRAGARPGS